MGIVSVPIDQSTASGFLHVTIMVTPFPMALLDSSAGTLG